MSVGASQKCGWGRVIRIRKTKGKCGIQPEVWLGKVMTKGECGSQWKV